MAIAMGNVEYVKSQESATGRELRGMVRDSVAIRPRGPWGSYKGLIAVERVTVGPQWTKVEGTCPSTGQAVARTWPSKCTFRVFKASL